MSHPYLTILPEVALALEEGRPVVALESTIIAHGMPYPQNVETARQVEDLVRSEGAIPATIGIIDGRIHVGLSAHHLTQLGQNPSVEKVSTRDIPTVLVTGRMGATTVAATMVAAQWAGIQVFVTGGLGGVHRGVEETWDISTDLTELTRCRVAVVCAGVKSILDIPKTLEVLETGGVPVIGLSCDEFPAFFTRSSGHPIPVRLDSIDQIARVIQTKNDLGLPGGVVVANPIPVESAMDPNLIDAVIKEALASAAARGVVGKAITPDLLSSIVQRTKGASLAANIALVKHNAKVGAQLALALARLTSRSPS